MAKYILLAGLLLLGCPLVLLGQCEPGVAEGISTDPDNPVNPQCSNLMFLNDFDWRDRDFLLDPEDPDATILSPFFNINASKISYVWNNDAYPLSAQDFHPADGWELIQFQPGESTFLTLYNKYTSILRFFFLLPESQEDYDAVTAEVRFDPPASNGGAVTALFHPTTGQSQALDQSSVGSVKSHVEYANSDNIFMNIDVPVEYDPCTCTGGASTLVIDFNRVDSMKLDLYGRYIDIEQNLASINQQGTGPINDDFLTQAFLSPDYTTVAGSHTFRRWDDLVNHYGELKEEQAQLKDRYDTYKAFGEFVEIVDKFSFFPKAAIITKSAKMLKKVGAYVKLFGAPVKKALANATARVNRLGVTNFTHGEMVLQGNIIDTSPVGEDISFNLPGSYAASECDEVLPELYPRYNEVLGRFALLQTPVVEYVYSFGGFNYSDLRAKLDISSLEYTFNPAANINEEDTEIWGSLQFTTTHGGYSDNPNGVYSNVELIEHVDNIMFWSTPLMPISCLGEYLVEIDALYYIFTQDFEVDLTIAIDYFFDGTGSDGERPRALQFYQYPVELSGDVVRTLDDILDGLVNPYLLVDDPTPAYEDELELGTTHFTENTTVFAWSSIIIEGELTVDDGVQVDIIAPNIQIIPDSWIDPDIDLYNDFTPFDCQPVEPESAAAVASFCQSSSYQANNAIQPLRQRDLGIPDPEYAVSTSDVDLGAAPLMAKIAPNPIGEGLGELLIDLEVADEVSIVLHDMTGRQLDVLLINQWLNEGAHRFDLPTQDLPAGNYFVRIEYAAGTQVVRFVK